MSAQARFRLQSYKIFPTFAIVLDRFRGLCIRDYALIKAPARGRILVGARGKGYGLVETDAGYVGGFDVVGCVIMLFREGYGEVLDAVFDAESLQEDDEVSEVFDEVVISFVGFDVA